MNIFSEEFFREHKKNSGKFPNWLLQLKEEAFQKFQKLGFPTSQDEEWRFTSVEQIKNSSFALPEKPKLNGEIREWLGAELFDLSPIRLVFVNGYFSKEHSSLQGLPEGVRVGTHLTSEGNGGNREGVNVFYFLNTAFFEEAAVITLPDGISLTEPIHLLFVSVSQEAPFFSSPRVYIAAGKNAKAKIIESYFGVGEGSVFNNVVTEIFVGENASLEHTSFQNEAKNSFHISNTRVQQEQNSSFVSYVLSASGCLIRNDLNVSLMGSGAECALNGLYLVSDGAHVDNHTAIDHLKAHCSSRELYKGILSGKSRAVFNGSIVVRPDAQKSDALQTNKNLLLSDEALVHSKPELKIFANDVKCKHGATIGQMDKNALFYLRSRGIPLQESRKLLLRGFAQEAIAGISPPPIIDFVNQKLALQ